MTTPDDLMRALGIPLHEEPEAGSFFMGLDGTWRHTCAADFPFQEDVELVFDMSVKSAQMPVTMPANIAWLQDHMADIWNAAAVGMNELATAHEIELDGDFQLEPMHFKLPMDDVETSMWSVSIEPCGLEGAFEISFRGLELVGQRYDG